MAEESHVLTIVIPALNEEAAIAHTIQRCLDARERVIEASRVGEVELIVVSDGSTDRTEEIACGFPDVTVLAFDRNRGYGAAIQCGFAHGRGDLVGFLDADGTCDPLFFADLCRAIDEEDADIAIGSRMGPGSHMPWVRAIGNTVLAWVLGALSRRSVRDTASGMRVLRRSCLPDLYPLPDGLHFTPAMSARVLMEDKLRLVERPMPYAERIGRSKLNVVRDGLRFLKEILFAATAFRPARPALAVAGVVALAAVATGAGPTLDWWTRGALDERAIYRVLLASLLATVAAIFVCAAVATERIAAAAHGRPPASTGVSGLVSRPFTRRGRRIGSALLLSAALLLVAPGLFELATTGTMTMHWVRAALAALLVAVAAMHAATTFQLNMMELIEARQNAGPAARPPERTHPAGRRAAAEID